MKSSTYIGPELELFSKAANWKSYYGSIIKPYFGESVLEVGAGFGATTEILCGPGQRKWLCLEPDTSMARRIQRRIAQQELPGCCEVKNLAVDSLSEDEQFDTIIYIDVLEHIEHDETELFHARKHLLPGGFLIILAPAHQALYTAFDKAIGHYRRYSKKSLADSVSVVGGFELVRLIYLDSAGALASLGNRLLLKQGIPTSRQLSFWDRVLVPTSRRLDPWVGFRLGKTVVGIWKRAATSP